MEYLVGEVVDVDRQSGKLVLRTAQKDGAKKQPGNSTTSGKENNLTLVTILLAADYHMPNCVRQGEDLRAWGAWHDEDPTKFYAIDLRAAQTWQADHTGIRWRLGKGCRKSQQKGNMNNE